MKMHANWFEQGGAAYAHYRPHYPASLVDYLASQVKVHGSVLDVGCGSGQLTKLLATRFDDVIGVDPSADQIAHAVPHEHLRYVCQAAEALDFAEHSVALITVAQAAHWFDLAKFYAAARRVAKPGAVLALISYGVLRFDEQCSDLNARFARFYHQEIGPYWPPERALVDSAYVGIDFPFDEIAAPSLDICLEWNRSQFLGYLATWSAVRAAREQSMRHLLEEFDRDLRVLWPDEEMGLQIQWPLAMRIGRIQKTN